MRHQGISRNEVPDAAEIRMRTRSGEYLIGEFSNLPLAEQGRVTIIFGIVRNVTDRKRAEEQLIRNAFYDRLTGLPNRTLFMDRLGQALLRKRRQSNYLFAVLFLDLDHFKMVNDSLGHLTGDLLLVHVGKRLKESVRADDTVARFGGDEFAILLDNLQDPGDVTRVAEEIRRQLMLPVQIEGHEVFSNCSIGIALGNNAYPGCEEILRDADTAMYRAKDLGRGRFEIFDIEMHARVVERLQLETDLRRAIERDEFDLCYQPIVSLETGRMTGLEALLRWKHPARGLLTPSQFIHVAEETGMIIPLGWWVLRTAGRQMNLWHQKSRKAAGLGLSVNLSARQFLQKDLAERVAVILQETGLDPATLHLEITESALMESGETINTTLSRLKSMDMRLHIDDFGTGYSSLSYLHRFSIDMLKIDRSFIQRMLFGSEHREIVRTIVALGKALRIPVTAEGVETESQYEELRVLGCDYGQGYLFGHPLSREECERVILDWPESVQQFAAPSLVQ
jgi:diguanylate cyclase (GGDEF)-like protein